MRKGRVGEGVKDLWYSSTKWGSSPDRAWGPACRSIGGRIHCSTACPRHRTRLAT